MGKQSLLEHLPSTQVICDLKGYLRLNVAVGLCPGKGDSDYTGKQQIQACEYGSDGDALGTKILVFESNPAAANMQGLFFRQ